MNIGWDGGAHAFILDTIVRSDMRRHGIGLELVRRAVDVARRANVEWVHVDYEPHLDEFYGKAGLRPTKEGVRVRSNHGKVSMTEGPFAETKEVIGGYAILEAPSMKEAIALTKRFLAVHGDEWNLECEVRPLDGQEFGPA